VPATIIGQSKDHR